MGIFPNFRGEHKNSLKPPPSVVLADPIPPPFVMKTSSACLITSFGMPQVENGSKTYFFWEPRGEVGTQL